MPAAIGEPVPVAQTETSEPYETPCKTRASNTEIDDCNIDSPTDAADSDEDVQIVEETGDRIADWLLSLPPEDAMQQVRGWGAQGPEAQGRQRLDLL
eukprot:8754563-Alexandrium_andersonii.AAC.1